MPFIVRVYKTLDKSTWEDKEFDTLEEAQSQIWGRGEDPYDNDYRPISYIGEVGYDVFDPEGVCVDTSHPERIGTVKP